MAVAPRESGGQKQHTSMLKWYLKWYFVEAGVPKYDNQLAGDEDSSRWVGFKIVDRCGICCARLSFVRFRGWDALLT